MLWTCGGKHLRLLLYLRACSSTSTAIVLHPACARAFTQASPIPAAPPATTKPHLCNHAQKPHAGLIMSCNVAFECLATLLLLHHCRTADITQVLTCDNCGLVMQQALGPDSGAGH